MTESEEKIYEALARLLQLKFKAQLRGSGLRLHELCSVDDVITGKRSYMLLIDDSVIRFKDTEQFVQKFIQLLKDNILEFNRRLADLQHHQRNDVVIDRYAMDAENELLSSLAQKQLKLLGKMRELLMASTHS